MIPGMLPAPQEQAINRLFETTEHIAVYSVDHIGDGFVIVHGQLITSGSVVTILRIVRPDGSYELVTDGLNQFHWLQDIEANRFPLLGKRTLNRAVRQVDFVCSYPSCDCQHVCRVTGREVGRKT